MAIVNISSKSKTSSITQVYESHKSGFIAFVRSYFSQLPMADIEEIYNDSFMVAHQDIQSGKLDNMTCTLQTYINQVGKFKIYDYYKKRKTPIDAFTDVDSPTVTNKLDKIWDDSTSARKKAVYEFVENMDDERCKKIIFGYYFDNLSMQVIAEQMKMKNANVAKTTKNRCMKKIKKALAQVLKSNGI